MQDASLRLVDSVEEAAAFMRWLGERRPVMGLDTETTGLKPYVKDTLRMVQFGDVHTGWAVSSQKWWGVCEEALRRYEGPVALQNAKFDFHFLELAGLPTPDWSRTHDTKIMSSLLHPNMPAGLKPVGERLWPGSSAGEHVLNEAKRKGKWTWATIPDDHPAYWAYAAWDPVLTARIAENYWQRVNAEGYRDAYDREQAVQAIMYRAESRGMRVDPRYTSELLTEWEAELGSLQYELDQLGLANPNSGRQIAQAMQITEKWDPTSFTDTGLPRTDASTLLALDTEISRRVLRFKRLKKWSSVYLRTFLNDRDSNDRVHPSINTLQARTGRMSITGPPMQTLPRGPVVRTCIIPSDGHKIVSVDYDTMEMRVFAHFSQDPNLMQAARDGIDLHRYTASMVYGVPMEDVDARQRQVAKNSVSFGKLYGAGNAAIALQAEVTLPEVEAFMAQYTPTFPGVEEFMGRVVQLGKLRRESDGEAYITTLGGRRAPADSDRLYALVNYLIQGGCADLLKDKLIALDNAGLGDDIILPVHDEGLFDFPAYEAEERTRVAVATMEELQMLSVPLTVSASEPVDNWGDAK